MAVSSVSSGAEASPSEGWGSSPCSPSSGSLSAWGSSSPLSSERSLEASSPMPMSEMIDLATLAKPAWSAMAATRRSRSRPALSSISARSMATTPRAPSGGGSPVIRSRAISASTSANGALVRSSIRAKPLRSISASRVTRRLARTPPSATAPIASCRACSRASNTTAAAASAGRARA